MEHVKSGSGLLGRGHGPLRPEVSGQLKRPTLTVGGGGGGGGGSVSVLDLPHVQQVPLVLHSKGIICLLQPSLVCLLKARTDGGMIANKYPACPSLKTLTLSYDILLNTYPMALCCFTTLYIAIIILRMLCVWRETHFKNGNFFFSIIQF